FVGTLPGWLKLRTPARDTILHPAIAYPTYEMGALLAGCRPVAVAVDDQWRLRLDTITAADAERALCLWVNSPGNPTLPSTTSAPRPRGAVPTTCPCSATSATWSTPGTGSGARSSTARRAL